ncbi:Uncharacterised protein [Raoultella terrigena]|uniref:Uncharacterized protein n=1 Tax=Raoultella terrigena TaxID=577 RepID=A0A3P8M3E8_RAOTE|nr:Uncharacterised protein [Raoultella terrigena]
MPLQVIHHFFYVLPNEMRQHKLIVQLGAPTDQRLVVRLVPETRHQATEQQQLHQRHARVRRHFEAAKLQQPQTAATAACRVQFVDAKILSDGYYR